jgi:hypothetical protein
MTQWTVADDKETLLPTAALRYGGRSANMNSSAINKHSAFRQVCASNPPHRKVAKHQPISSLISALTFF